MPAPQPDEAIQGVMTPPRSPANRVWPPGAKASDAIPGPELVRVRCNAQFAVDQKQMVWSRQPETRVAAVGRKSQRGDRIGAGGKIIGALGEGGAVAQSTGVEHHDFLNHIRVLTGDRQQGAIGGKGHAAHHAVIKSNLCRCR